MSAHTIELLVVCLGSSSGLAECWLDRLCDDTAAHSLCCVAYVLAWVAEQQHLEVLVQAVAHNHTASQQLTHLQVVGMEKTGTTGTT